MKSTLAIGLLSLLCLSCGATDVAANIEPAESAQSTRSEINQDTSNQISSEQMTTDQVVPEKSAIDQAAIDTSIEVASGAPQYSGEIGTVAGDRALSDFLFAHDGAVVNLNISTHAEDPHHGEDWFSLCAEAHDGDNCTAVSINYVPATELDTFWQTSNTTDSLNGFYIVQANPGMHQGFLSISLLGLP